MLNKHELKYFAKEAGFKVGDGYIIASDSGIDGNATDSVPKLIDLILKQAIIEVANMDVALTPENVRKTLSEVFGVTYE